MSKSATLPAEPFEDPQHTLGTPAWKQEVNQRLAAHRTRRSGPQDTAEQHAAENTRTASARAAEAAARVAARYAKAPSYSELLAGEARAVVRAAGAAAVAARNAQAAAQAVLAGLESGPVASGTWEPEERRPDVSMQKAQEAAPARWQDEPPAVEAEVTEYAAPREKAWAGAQPRWQEALPAHSADRDVWAEMRVHPGTHPSPDHRREESRSYRRGREEHYTATPDEGELFPLDPLASATVEPVQHLPANLIEFPRELVATRKARPRLAEGPFYNADQENPQLNIFEVDPAVLAAPVYLSGTSANAVAPPEWASIELDRSPEPVYSESPAYSENIDHRQAYAHETYAHETEALNGLGNAVNAMPVGGHVAGRADGYTIPAPPTREARRKLLQKSSLEPPAARAKAVAAELLVAPVSDRLLAFVVDGALIALAFLAAAVLVIASTEHPPTGRTAMIAAGCGLLFFGLLYQFLFLSYAEEGTPGMRYARIALCTFDDDNPPVEQMRLRIPAMLLATLPAALGLLWALFDANHLGWHDRLTKTYQRKY